MQYARFLTTFSLSTPHFFHASRFLINLYHPMPPPNAYHHPHIYPLTRFLSLHSIPFMHIHFSFIYPILPTSPISSFSYHPHTPYISCPYPLPYSSLTSSFYSLSMPTPPPKPTQTHHRSCSCFRSSHYHVAPLSLSNNFIEPTSRHHLPLPLISFFSHPFAPSPLLRVELQASIPISHPLHHHFQAHF